MGTYIFQRNYILQRHIFELDYVVYYICTYIFQPVRIPGLNIYDSNTRESARDRPGRLQPPDAAFSSLSEHRADRIQAINPLFTDVVISLKRDFRRRRGAYPAPGECTGVHRMVIKYIYTRIGDADSAVSICRSEQRREQRARLPPTQTDDGSNCLLPQMSKSYERVI